MMGPTRAASLRLLSILIFGSLVGCQPLWAGEQAAERESAMPPTAALRLDDASIQVNEVDLRSSYQTYYLMSYPPPGELFLRLVLSLEGFDDPVAWGERNLQLDFSGERREPVLARTVTVGEGYQYLSSEPLEFVYEFFFLVPATDAEVQYELLVVGEGRLPLPPLSPVKEPSVERRAEKPPAMILSGGGNQARAEGALVVGGRDNWAKATFSVVGGGRLNRSPLAYSTVAGGRENMAGGFYAAVGGGYANRTTGREAAVAGGSRNEAGARYTAIGGGIQNRALSSGATVAGGAYNQADGVQAAIGGGTRNQAGGDLSVVAGGAGNASVGQQSAVLGGLGNSAEGAYSVVVGGYDNRAVGDYAVALGGEANGALGNHSLAAGRGAAVGPEHHGAMVLADSQASHFSSVAADEFAVRATGGVRFVSAIGEDGSSMSGVILAPGSGSWSVLSDRRQKVDGQMIDPRAVLHRVGSLEITSWRYRSQGAGVRHLGPTAQDFHGAYGLGESDRHISAVDADGVALAAIQGLLMELEDRDQRLARLDREVSDLERRLVRLEGTAKDPAATPFGQWVIQLTVVGISLAAGWLLRSRAGPWRREALWKPRASRSEPGGRMPKAGNKGFD